MSVSTFSMASLLAYDDLVPTRVREALRAASSAPADEKEASLTSAARLLYRETGVDCADARELLGLAPGSCT